MPNGFAKRGGQWSGKIRSVHDVLIGGLAKIAWQPMLIDPFVPNDRARYRSVDKLVDLGLVGESNYKTRPASWQVFCGYAST